jgi:hypothetical protein
MTFRLQRTAVAAAATLAVFSAQATQINLIDLGGVTGSAAEQGFNIAAGYWGGLFTNNATINLGVKFQALNPGVIGSTGSTRADLSVSSWQALVGATRSNSTIDMTAVLPTLVGGGITGLTTGVDGSGNNDTTVTAVLNGSQTSSRVLYQNTSLIKALGGSVAPSVVDATITFSSNFSFDFDPTDGITAGTFDFIGVAIHEIGHALGFVSGVDFFDVYGKPNGPGAGQLGYDLNDTSVFSALDMFRYSAPGTIDLQTGGTPYFSIDGGNTALCCSCAARSVAAIGGRLVGRDELVLAVADQVGPAHGLQRLAQQRPVVGVVPAQEGLVQAAAALAAHDVHLFSRAPAPRRG